jgi:aldehyde:ferredoxin oxidoreductase
VFRDFHREAAELLAAVTGWDIDADELRDLGRRIVESRKAYNIREGWLPSDDTLPERFFAEATGGGAEGARLPRERLAEMIRSYNLARGWTEDGYLRDEAAETYGIQTTK